MKLNKSKNGGFTLIELLATIVILSIVASLAIIFTSELSNKSKEKVYLATANSLVNAAGIYVNEGDGSSKWHDCESGNCQYQCVLVENLMDNAYFSADILQSELAKDKKVVPTNVVYLERNKDTKSITQKYVVADGKTCGGVNRTKSNNPTVIIGKTLYHNGNDQSLVSVGSSPKGTIYYSVGSALDSSNYNTSGTTRIPQREEIGEYTVYYYIEGNDNFNDKSGKVTSVILKDRPVVSLEPIKLTYTGKPQTLVKVINNNRSTIYYSLKDKLSSSNYQNGSFTVPSGTDAGEYIVYYYAISTTTLSTELGNVSVLIEKAENPIVITANTLTYNGKEQELVTTKDAQGEVYYSKKNELNYDNYKSYGLKDIPVEVNAGKYTVYYYVEGNKNYKDKSGSIEVTIEKAENPIVVTANTLTYTGRQQILATTTKAEGTVYYSKTTKLTSSNYIGNAKVIPTGTNAGRYMVYYYVTGNDNYKDKSGSVTARINKAENPIVVTGNISTYTNGYKSLVSTSSAQGTVYYSTTISLTSSNYSKGSTTIPMGLNAGAYTVYYYVTGNNNYNSKSGSVIARINKANNPIIVSGKTLKYTGQSQSLVSTSSAQGTVYYSTTTILNSSNYYSKGYTVIPTGTSVGTYTIYYYVTGNTNYYYENGSVITTIKEPTCSSGYTMISGKCCPSGYDTLSGNYCVRTGFTYDGSACYGTVSYLHQSTAYDSRLDATLYNSGSSSCKRLGSSFNYFSMGNKRTYSCNFYTASNYVRGGTCTSVDFKCKSTVVSDCTVVATNPS